MPKARDAERERNDKDRKVPYHPRRATLEEGVRRALSVSAQVAERDKVLVSRGTEPTEYVLTLNVSLKGDDIERIRALAGKKVPVWFDPDGIFGYLGDGAGVKVRGAASVWKSRKRLQKMLKPYADLDVKWDKLTINQIRLVLAIANPMDRTPVAQKLLIAGVHPQELERVEGNKWFADAKEKLSKWHLDAELGVLFDKAVVKHLESDACPPAVLKMVAEMLNRVQKDTGTTVNVNMQERQEAAQDLSKMDGKDRLELLKMMQDRLERDSVVDANLRDSDDD